MVFRVLRLPTIQEMIALPVLSIAAATLEDNPAEFDIDAQDDAAQLARPEQVLIFQRPLGPDCCRVFAWCQDEEGVVDLGQFAAAVA